MTQNEIRDKVNRYRELSNQVDLAKKELDTLKAEFEQLAQRDLEDTKNKTIEYWGDDAKVIVQNQETVKPIAFNVLRQLLGESWNDFVKEEQKIILKDNCKTFLNAMFQGAYIEDTIPALVSRITADEKMQKVLCKKLKGKYKQDMNNLIKLLGMSESDASDLAYLISEVFAYQTIQQIMKASHYEGTIEEAVAQVKAAIIVDESIKVTLEAA